VMKECVVVGVVVRGGGELLVAVESRHRGSVRSGINKTTSLVRSMQVFFRRSIGRWASILTAT
jgi:hypothetical protein